MSKVTIHRALSELKLIDSKITKQINSIDPVGIFQKGKLVNATATEIDFTKLATSKYQSALDLISQKGKIKSAIVAANAVTKLKVGDREMTIADAINEKANIKFKKDLLVRLQKGYDQAVGILNKNNEIANSNVQKLLETVFGKENVKADMKDMDTVRKPYIEANEFHLCDPLKVKEEVEKLDTEISKFESEVDSALSEINAVTLIEY